MFVGSNNFKTFRDMKNRKSVEYHVIGNLLPQYVIKMMDMGRLEVGMRESFGFVSPWRCIRVEWVFGEKCWHDKCFYVIPRAALKVSEDVFVERAKNMMKCLGFSGFRFV